MKYLDAMGRSTRSTAKYRHYAARYDEVLATLPPRPTVVEIGVANGGSLQTWRALLGDGARIIGIDLNEGSRVLEDEGFEIFVLDMGRDESWDELRSRLARSVDLLVDDGGHTNRQQISTLVHGVDLVRDGGWLVVEDLHASYMRHFGNPHPYSTARFLNDLYSDLHRLHPRSDARPKHHNLASSIGYIVTTTSWVGLRIDRRRAGALVEVTGGSDTSLMDYDHRWDSSVGQHLVGRVPQVVLRLLRNPYGRFVESLALRRLFRRDSSPEQDVTKEG